MIVEDSSFHCRVVVIGDASVGKTSLLNQLIDHTFNEHEQSTVGANYQLLVQEIEGIKVEVQIWDTAGQEKFRSLGPIYFRNALGAVAVYDQTNKQSFDNLGMWIKSFTDVASTETVIAIAANKCDLEDASQVSIDEAKTWAQNNGYIIEQTSAKTGNGVKSLFMDLTKELLKCQSAKQRHQSIMRPRQEPSPCSC